METAAESGKRRRTAGAEPEKGATKAAPFQLPVQVNTLTFPLLFSPLCSYTKNL
jgi:hypothetical protein